MSSTTIQLPVSLARISRRLPAELLAEGMSYAIRKRINEERKLLRQAEKKINALERKYKTTYQSFLQKTPPKKEQSAHQDWVEWSFWAKVREEAKEDLSLYSKIYHSGLR